MVSTIININIPTGLHLRPISVLCNRAVDYKSAITIKKGEKCVNAKSLIGVLSACIKYQDVIELICDGSDEEVALNELSRLIENGLGDEIIKK